MSFPATLLDLSGVPVPCTYVPGVGFFAMMGSPTTNTDGLGNAYTPIAFDLNQISDQPVTMAGNDGLTPNTVLQIANGRFNGLTIDQDRGNLDTFTFLNVVGATTSQNSGTLTNYNHRGITIILTTSVIGTGNITLSINGYEPVSNFSWPLLTGAAVSTNTTNVYKVYPGLTAVTNQVANDILPRSFQINVAANNANAATYAVYGMLHL